jgi:hypothetical protein
MTCRRTSNGSKRAFDQLESWWLLNLTLGGLGAVEEVVEIDPDLKEQRARVQPNGKPSAGGFDPAEGFLYSRALGGS